MSNRARKRRKFALRTKPGWPALLAADLNCSQRCREKLRRKCAHKATRSRIHQLRVATRRHLALAQLAGAVGRVPTREISRSLRHCLKCTSKLRDAAVQFELLGEFVRKFPEIERLRRVLRRTTRHRARLAEKKLAREKRSPAKRLRTLTAGLPAAVKKRPRAEAALLRALRDACGSAARTELNARRGGKSLHRARLALKRLRYMAEALHGIVPGITAAWLRDLQRRQRQLGDIHDLQLLDRRMHKFAARHPRVALPFQQARGILAERTRQMLRAYRPGVRQRAPGFLGK